MKIVCPNWDDYRSMGNANYWNTDCAEYSPVKMTIANGTSLASKIHRKVFRVPSKRHPGKILPGKLQSIAKISPGKLSGKKMLPRPSTAAPVCDNSNDSGLGFDRSSDTQPYQNNPLGVVRPVGQNRLMPSLVRNGKMPGKRPMANASTLMNGQATNVSRDGKVQLQILAQPEQQHRARYQTEGSRGAVKDRSGNGFPVVRLIGYNKSALLQVYIGTDIGRVAPHMFYQACKVSGKNSTPCNEKKLDGTIVIEVDMKADTEMTVTCDCVGILKERNVDVEHRFPDQSASRNKKKSTRCRMVFRSTITNDDGTTEVLQACSQPIVCTQPPGVPEICKKSLVSCPVDGGLELFVIGKNFLKDTKVVFQKRKSSSNTINLQWEEAVVPDKEYLQQTHLVCTVPPYLSQDIIEPTIVQIYILSGGKKSETHNFTYTPKNSHTALTAATTCSSYFNGIQGTIQTQNSSSSHSQDAIYDDSQSSATNSNSAKTSLFLWNSASLQQNSGCTNMDTKNDLDSLMPPPVVIPLSVRRPSLMGDQLSLSPPANGILKSEIIDENSSSPMNEDSMERFPGSTDNSMDGGSIFYRRRTNSIIEDSSNISMIVNDNTMTMSSVISENSMSVFHPPQVMPMMTVSKETDMDVIDLRIKQEQMAAAAAAANPFLSKNMQVDSLYTTQTNPNESTFTSSLVNHQMLDLPSNVASVPTNADNLMDAHRSSITQDIILNSQNVISLNQSNLPMITNGPNNDHVTMSPEIILNPQVAPTSLMCPPTPDPNALLSPQVLNNMAAMAAAQNQQIINPIMTQAEKDSTAVVKNMILNAAADILTSQEPSVSTQSTINAIMTDIISQQAQIMPDVMMPSCSPVVVSATQQQQQQQFVNHMMTEQSSNNDTLMQQVQHQQQQQQQPPIPQEITTMSDNDLISYINPSCFDQV